MGKTITVTGDRGQYVIDKSGKTWVFDKDCHITSASNGINTDLDVINTTVVIKGKVEAGTGNTFVALSAYGDDYSVTIAKGGKALGAFGVVTHGAGSDVDNFGTSNAIRLYGADSTATNSGRITSDFQGMATWEADGCTIINEKSGRIDVSFEFNIYAPAMRLNTLDGQSATAINKGTILSGHVSGGAGADTFINSGTVNNDVVMFDGDDTVKNVGGTIKGVIATGAGSDTLVTDNRNDHLTESLGQGRDTVKSSVTYQLNDNVERLLLTGKKDIDAKGSDTATTNYLQGNSGDNALFGYGGVDGLSGGKGKDRLTGGAGYDFFELAKGSGKDTVMDFTDGDDVIAVNGFAGIDDASDMTAHMRQKNGFVEIDMGKGDIMIVKGALIGQLDFMFNASEELMFAIYP